MVRKNGRSVENRVRKRRRERREERSGQKGEEERRGHEKIKRRGIEAFRVTKKK